MSDFGDIERHREANVDYFGEAMRPHLACPKCGSTDLAPPDKNEYLCCHDCEYEFTEEEATVV